MVYHVLQYNWNMQYVDDPEIKGDCEIIPRGAVTLANREQLNVRRVEFLQITGSQLAQLKVRKDKQWTLARRAVLLPLRQGSP